MLAIDLQHPRSRAPFTYPKVLLAEGRSAFQFFKALLQRLGLLAEIEIRNYGGVDDLNTYLEALPVISGFSTVTALGITRDAEDQEVNSAFQSVCSGLRRARLSVPIGPMSVAEGNPRTAVFILPDCSHSGMLETLCLDAVADDPASPCVDRYFECLQSQNASLPRNISKAKVQVFLASRPGYIAHLGEAAHRGYWDWGNPVFDLLKQFLRAL